MDHNYHMMSSPIAHSERKDSLTYPIFSLGKKYECQDEFSQINFETPNDDLHNDNHSIFNMIYSPQPRGAEQKSSKIPRDLMIPFPILTQASLTESPNSVKFRPREKLPSLCQMFDINKNQVELQSVEQNSNPDELLSSIFNRPSKNNEVVKDYLNRLMNHDEEETKNFSEFENNIKSKGLKLLSIIVFDIVTDKGSTSYKEVADLILKDTINSPRNKEEKKTELSREEQNIKRRVYDVLNVLISANTFLKEGKIVKKNNLNIDIIIKNKRAQLNSMYSKLVRS